MLLVEKAKLKNALKYILANETRYIWLWFLTLKKQIGLFDIRRVINIYNLL